MEVSDVQKMQIHKDVEGLIKALKEKDWHVRIWTVGALGEIRDKKAIEPLTPASALRLNL
jgi:HEAT repeat protein